MQAVRTWRIGDHRVVGLSGRLDHCGASQVRPVLIRVVEDRPDPRIVVDLAAVELCDSSGLGMLVGAHKRAAAAGGSLVLAGSRPSVAHVLNITGLDRILPTYPSVEEATRTRRAEASVGKDQ